MKHHSTMARAIAVLLGLSTYIAGAWASAVTLAPALAGQYAAGSGVDASFLKVYDDWHASTVLWDEDNGTYGSGAPIGTYGWGSGLWGIVDWQKANAHVLPSNMIESRWSGRVGSISFGDVYYYRKWGATWGSVAIAPLFTQARALTSQNNWTSSFAGYIRITEPGSYNFGVLSDDGFFFTLGGSDWTQGLSNDHLNPRDRIGFGVDLPLVAGLYSFELGAYDRLEAGVVQLAWARDGGALSIIPKEDLVAPGDVSRIPEPGTLALTLAALAASAALALRRRIAAR